MFVPREGLGLTKASVLARINEEADDGFLAKRLGGLQPMEAFDEDETCAVRPHQDWRLLAFLEHAQCDFVHALLFEGGAPFDRYVDVGDRESLALHHDRDRR